MTFDELMNAYHINDELCNRAVYNNLLKEIKSNHVTPVIGSGLSLWAGYPSWGSFIREKAKGTKVEAKVLTLMYSNQFEKAMQELSDYYKPNRFLRVLENEFSTDKIDESMRPAYQKLLPKLFKGPFVTTNYDVCLERLLDAPYTVNPLDEYNEAAINSHLQNNQHFLIKMRGTITDPTHLLVTEESSNAAYGIDPMIPDRSLPLIKTLETVFQSSSPLFLGCSLGADRASMVLQSCMGTTGYALVEMPWNPDDFDMADARFDEMNLQVIWYPHGQHEAVEALINQLFEDMFDLFKNADPILLLQKIDDGYRCTKKEASQISNIESLKLNGTMRTSLPKSIGLLKSLKTLFLQESSIEALPESIGQLTKLEILDLKNSKIKKLPDSIGDLISLQHLCLSKTKIAKLPESIGRLSNLQRLDLSHTNISAFPECILKLEKLEILDLRNTRITFIPDSIKLLTNLHTFSLGGSSINSLPESIGFIKSLKTLSLKGSSISTMPESIGKLTALETLDLGNSRISELPNSIGELVSLQCLYLSETIISTLPKSLGQLSNLKILNLYHTNISTFPECILQLKKLEVLDLRNTSISFIPNSIELLTNLQTLSLGGSSITALPENLCRLPNLESLGISDTKIDILPDWIGEIPKLRHINLMRLSLPLIPKSLALSGLPFVDEMRFRVLADGINVHGTVLKEQNISIFLNEPELIPYLYREQQNDYIAQEATKIIMDALGNDNDVILNYHQFLDVVNSNVTEQMLPYLTESYSFLFTLDENQSKLTAAYDSELQEVLYQLFLIDCGKGIRHQTENNVKAHKNSQSTEQADQNVHEKVTDESSQEKSFYSTPSDLEKATELVLKEFVNWLSEERKQQGLFFEISIPSHRQKAGLQYGYDVGVGTTENRERFNLCFECKHYKTNMTDKENNKQSVLKVENYSYNLLQYYMHCNKDVNNRWILVSTYGDLQNDFPQKLFENWNIEHHYLKIFAITESSSDDKTKSFSNITCKEFLSVSDEAYKMVYGEYPSDHLSKDKVFKWLNETVIGKDWVEVNIQKRLRYSTVPLPAGYRCRDSHEPLLRIQSKTQADALNEILQSLVKIDIPFGFDSYPDKYGVFVIGEYGTGKTWLSCQTIEEIIRHPGKYPFEPFYFELKGILKKHSGTTLNKNMIEATAQEYVDSKLIAEALEAASKADASVFFLDGLDETLSGLSFTDAKISLLYSIMDAVRSVIPKSLFVVTSRESDYKACKNHSAFSKLIKDFTEIKLEDCTRNQVKQNIKEIALQSEKDSARLNQLLQNESFIGIICRPVFYSFLSCIVEREEFARNSDEQLKEYDVLDEIIKNELQKMCIPADCEKQLYNYAITVTCSPDVTLTAEVEDQEQLHEDTIAGIVPVGIFDITITTKRKPPIISFKHNIIREFLVAKYLYSLLKESVSNNTTDSTDRLIRKLKEVPMNVAIQKFFMESISKDENNSEILHEKLLDILITKKENTALATKLLEILLLPGNSLCGSENNKLNLTNLHAQNLYLWNCVLQNLDLRNSFIDGFQLINADLIDINFQGATIRNLQLCSDIPIVGSTCWHEGRTYSVVLLLENGQLLQYSIRDQFDSEHIQVQLIGKARRDMFDGVFHLNSNLYLFQKKRIYSSQSIKLYELNSNCRILKIEPMNSSWSYLVDVDGVAYALFFIDNRFDCCCIGQSNTINIDSFCFISNDVFAYNQEGRLILQNHKQKITVPNPTDEISCFCGCTIDSDLIKLYLLSEDSVIILKITNFEETVVEKKLPIKMVSKFFKHVKPLNDWVLLSTDESSAYLIKLHESKCEVVELTSGVKCRGLMLGDGENEKRVEDDESYELLRLMNS